ncbi:TPA: DNA/RNA non-specific endonuclease [Streptococcus suis]
MAIKKRNEGTGGCLGRLFYSFLGMLVILGAISFAASSNIDFGTLLNQIKNADLEGIVTSTKQSISELQTSLETPSNSANNGKPSKTSPTSNETNLSAENGTYTPLPFSGKLQLVLGEYDSLGRATSAHIQLKESDEPASGTREPRITYDPVGWHNYKFNYLDENNNVKQAWLMNRGHLVGYQFSGLNSEGKNLVPITRYLNVGTMSDKGMDAGNYNSMLFYENQLDDWLAANKDFYLDLLVVPNYSGEELLPRTISMYWTAFNSNGNQISVELNQNGIAKKSGLIGSVTLSNVSPNAEIDYKTGFATALIK